ncbi:hypothetical protein HU200_026786 [Digitaria exilis]|uniref:Uncharacterized protein n=1 Tax=Digitaria exilis TaxID=1010633 RepID=A0A835BUS8_9POAL|nr:hypothetical protein HU200_026786 [Digitaria exilis]
MRSKELVSLVRCSRFNTDGSIDISGFLVAGSGSTVGMEKSCRFSTSKSPTTQEITRSFVMAILNHAVTTTANGNSPPAATAAAMAPLDADELTKAWTLEQIIFVVP